MELLKDILNTLTEEDLSALPPVKNDEIKKNIRDGAKDIAQNWANALELVHKAYEVAQVERPTPNMKEGWKQYEENLQYAVEQLAKTRGMRADWRMSASVFHEAQQPTHKFEVRLVMGGQDIRAEVEGKSIDDVLEMMRKYVEGKTEHPLDFEVQDELAMGRVYRITHTGPVKAKTNYRLTIEKTS